jgi:hypothetical protein
VTVDINSLQIYSVNNSCALVGLTSIKVCLIFLLYEVMRVSGGIAALTFNLDTSWGDRSASPTGRFTSWKKVSSTYSI